MTEFVEIESGGKNLRPVLVQSIAQCRISGATLLIGKLDRLACDTAFVAFLIECGVQFVAANIACHKKLMVPRPSGPAELQGERLTFDKPPLSKSKNEELERSSGLFVINDTKHLESALAEGVADFVRDSLAENTRRAYSSDLARFEIWGGELPASAEMIATYLTQHASSHAPTTLVRWLASLSKAHRAMRADDPTKAELVKSVLRGIFRNHGRPQAQATPLTREILFELLEAVPDDLRGMRDRALLLVGFAGGFRRSELVALQTDDLERVGEGLATLFPRNSLTR